MEAVERLLAIMARLRDPERGCPWDREQDFASIAPYTIEEAYEVDDAIRRGDMEDLLGELGDLLFQVVYHAQIASEAGHFDFEGVAEGIGEKLVRRHPHVFGEASADSPEAVRSDWESAKARERAERAARRSLFADVFSGVPAHGPALMRAAKLQQRADRNKEPASLGAASRALREAVDALPENGEIAAGDRVGDLLLASVAAARALGVDPERALRDANARFEARVREARGDPGSID